MKHVNALLTILAIGSVFACGSAADERVDESTASLSNVTLTCKSLSFAKGSLPAGQSATTLASAQLTGTEDVWDEYVELSGGSDATCKFALPSGTSASSIASVSVVTNYRGPTKAAMTWRFWAWDFAASAWVQIGDNGFASAWTWTAATLPLPAPTTRFFSSTGGLRIRYSADNANDASDLDQLVVVASTSTTTTAPPPDTSTSSGSTTGIWQPHPGTSAQVQLSGTIDTSVDAQMYDFDLIDTPDSTISALKARGTKVICYFSAGSYEQWRPDANQFPSAALGNVMDGWPDERWLDIRSSGVRDIMLARMDLAKQKGCDGVDPDNVDGYTNTTGFPLTAADQLDYNKFLATSAHARGLAVGLKNDVNQVKDLVSYFDFAVNEQCFQYNECDLELPFIAANKSVINIEYGGSTLQSTICPKANAANFDTLIKKLALDAWRIACR